MKVLLCRVREVALLDDGKVWRLELETSTGSLAGYVQVEPQHPELKVRLQAREVFRMLEAPHDAKPYQLTGLYGYYSRRAKTLISKEEANGS